jgi:hypothetical protein
MHAKASSTTALDTIFGLSSRSVSIKKARLDRHPRFNWLPLWSERKQTGSGPAPQDSKGLGSPAKIPVVVTGRRQWSAIRIRRRARAFFHGAAVFAYAHDRPVEGGRDLGLARRTLSAQRLTSRRSRSAIQHVRFRPAHDPDVVFVSHSHLFNCDLNAPILLSALRVVATVRICVRRNPFRLTEAAGRDDRFGNAFLFHQPVFHRLRALL